jgi:hypothetical protein
LFRTFAQFTHEKGPSDPSRLLLPSFRALDIVKT